MKEFTCAFLLFLAIISDILLTIFLVSTACRLMPPLVAVIISVMIISAGMALLHSIWFKAFYGDW